MEHLFGSLSPHKDARQFVATQRSLLAKSVHESQHEATEEVLRRVTAYWVIGHTEMAREALKRLPWGTTYPARHARAALSVHGEHAPLVVIHSVLEWAGVEERGGGGPAGLGSFAA